MWRNYAKEALLRNRSSSLASRTCSSSPSFPNVQSNRHGEPKPRPFEPIGGSELRLGAALLRNAARVDGFVRRGFSSSAAAEAVFPSSSSPSSTKAEDDEAARREYERLRRRQVKVETEAWERASREYSELVEDMCEHKLAPNIHKYTSTH